MILLWKNGVFMKKLVKKYVVLAGMLLLSSSITSAMNPKLTSEPLITFTSDSIKLHDGLKTFFGTPLRTALSLTTLYGISWIKRQYDFYHIDQCLVQSAPIVTDPQCFKFSGWRLCQPYEAASDLLNNHGDAINKLYNDIFKNNLFFKDANKCAISATTLMEEYINSNNLDKQILVNDQGSFYKEILNNAFLDEMQEIREKLEYLSQFTPFTILLQKNANHHFGQPTRGNKTTNNLVLMHCKNAIDSGKIQLFENLIEKINTWLKQNSKLENYLLFRSPLMLRAQQEDDEEKECDAAGVQLPSTYQKLSLNPWNWKICNSNKASKLYYQMIKRYLRLLALEYIVNNPSPDLLQQEE